MIEPIPDKKPFGAELLAAAIPPMPEEKREQMIKTMAFFDNSPTPEDAWERVVMSGRQQTLDHFTKSGLNSDAFNSAMGVGYELMTMSPGKTFESPACQKYADYFKSKDNPDSADLEFTLSHSNSNSVQMFDALIDDINALIIGPMTAELIEKVRDRLRTMYRLIYSKEPNF